MKNHEKQELITPFSTRQYMESKDFEVYYYSDHHPKPVSSHTHDYYEFYFFLEGDVEIVISDEPHRIHPGDFLLIPPGTAHYPKILQEGKPYRRFILWISPEYCNQLLTASSDYAFLMQYVQTNHVYQFDTDTITFHTIESKLFHIISEIKGNRFGKTAYLSLAVNELILYLNRLIHERLGNRRDHKENNLAHALERYIEEHLCDNLSLDELEKLFFASKYYISHCFKDAYGISIHQYISKKRLYACRDAIICQEPITETFEKFGFQDYSSFYRAFKKEFGASPKEYQKMW